jgi:predicted negative regulator of RcsB-dependent stress response
LGTKRLTRKEIVQEDKIHSSLVGLLDWFNKNAKLLAIAGVVVLLAIGGTYLWRHLNRSQNEELQASFADALQIHSAPAGKDATTNTAAPTSNKYSFATTQEREQKALAKFKQIADESPGSDIGQLARYYVALNQYQLGKTAEAKSTLESLVGDADTAVTRNLARGMLIQLSEQANNHEQSIKMLSQILAEPTPAMPKNVVLFQMGQIYETMGKNDEASKRYKEITTEFPNSDEAKQAEAQLARLKSAK